ncbi:MAG TPA: hypothetical protein VH760_12610 [Gaiellaceae bacterium]
MKNVVLLVVLTASAVALVPQATARQQAPQRARAVKQVTPDPGRGRAVLGVIASHRDETWRWQRVMQRPRTPFGRSATRASSPAYRHWVAGLWQHRAIVARMTAHRPPHRSQWLCIHRYEGEWDDAGAPYYGGLQMDVGFQQAYGIELYRAKGTADHWTPLEQMWVAERAHEARGFQPWPNTARFCGLL